MGQSGRVIQKRFLVAIPVPSLDRNGTPLDPAEITDWVKKTQQELTECFGGASPIPAPGTNVLEGQIVYEQDQMLVLSACDSRDEFLREESRIRTFSERMGAALRQESVFVLACPSDCFLVEIQSTRK